MQEKYKKAYDFFVNDGFLPLDNKNYPLLLKYNKSSCLHDKNITTYCLWQKAFFGLYKIIDEYLCCVFFHEERGGVYWTIHRPQENSTFPLQPIIDILWEYCKKVEHQHLQIKFIDEYMLGEYEAIQGYTIQTEHDIRCSEYAYTIKDLRNLAGSANYNKRRRIKIFSQRQDISIRPMTNDNIRTCLEIENEWCSHQDCAYCRSFFGCDKEALIVMLDLFDDKIHQGVFLYENEKPVGYIICEKLNEKCSLCYFGKSTINEGFKYIIYKMYNDFLTDVEYMNINEDMGHDGLRTFKKQLAPYELWHKYMVTYKETSKKSF